MTEIKTERTWLDDLKDGLVLMLMMVIVPPQVLPIFYRVFCARIKQRTRR